MNSGDLRPRAQAGSSIFEFEGYVNDDEEGLRDRDTAIDPLWEKQQKKVMFIFDYWCHVSDVHRLV